LFFQDLRQFAIDPQETVGFLHCGRSVRLRSCRFWIPQKRVVKPLGWFVYAKKDLLTMPDTVIDVVWYALHLAQHRLLKH
jgi:hypothetical protein